MSNYMKSMSDLTLMKFISRGQEDALKELMDRHIEIVALTAYRIMCDHEESVSVVRKVFSNIWKKPFKYDYSMDIRSRLLMSAIDLSRRRLVRNSIISFFGVHPNIFDGSTPKADEVDDYITTQAWEVFCRASFGMRPLQRIVYTLRELDAVSEVMSEQITGLNKPRLTHLLDKARRHICSELNKFGKVKEYKPYLGFLRNVRDGMADYEGLEEEILYLCAKMH